MLLLEQNFCSNVAIWQEMYVSAESPAVGMGGVQELQVQDLLCLNQGRAFHKMGV